MIATEIKSEVFLLDCVEGMKAYPDNHFDLAICDYIFAYNVCTMYICNMKKINDLQIGKAGEYLVCADLILSGYVAFPSEQGLPFDVVLDLDGKLLKVQVKTTRESKHIPQRKTDVPAYVFHIGVNGGSKGSSRRIKYNKSDVDIFALVALDSKRIAYLPYFNTQTTMNFRVPEQRGNYYDEKGIMLKKQVLDLKKSGLDCSEIALKLNLKLSNVYKYSSVDITQTKKAGVYFDEFTLDKCLCQLAK